MPLDPKGNVSDQGRCSYCWAKVPWQKYAAHLKKWHPNGAAINPMDKALKNITSLLGTDLQEMKSGQKH
jgi:hypothetical protein